MALKSEYANRLEKVRLISGVGLREENLSTEELRQLLADILCATRGQPLSDETLKRLRSGLTP